MSLMRELFSCHDLKRLHSGPFTQIETFITPKLLKVTALAVYPQILGTVKTICIALFYN